MLKIRDIPTLTYLSPPIHQLGLQSPLSARFLDEGIVVRGAREAVQNSLQAILDENQAEVVFARAGEIAQLLANRCRKIFRRAFAQLRDSM